VTDSKAKSIHLICKSDELIEPLSLAMRQLEGLHKWNDQNIDSPLSKEAVVQAVAFFHPDKNPDREAVNSFGLWKQWEGGIFSPDEFKPWARLAIAQGNNAFADLGSVDHHKMAMIAAAQLAAYEGNMLRVAAFHTTPQDTPTVWRRLYWFTRFFKAWGNICREYTPTAFAKADKKALKTRAWKRAAWNAYTDTLSKLPKNRKPSARTFATNFCKARSGELSVYTVQTYILERLTLLTAGKAPDKKTIGRGTPNKRQ
jgi:hypothetical protein